LDTLATAYQAAEFDSGDEAGYASRTYARELRRILPRLPDLDEALDIGTGDGAFLEELLALQFSSVHGVEPSEAPIESAKAHIKPLIHSGLFQPQMFSPASFSLVTCFQTMEHVWSPLDLVRGAFGLLKPGGAVAIVIHNRHALSAKVLGMKSPIFDLEHLQLFCPSTGKRLLQEAGFRDVTVSAFWNRYPIRYWVKLLPLSDKFKRPLVRLLSESAAGMFPVAIPAGNLICVGFK
jgi:SAM-dependent methyltransferase